MPHHPEPLAIYIHWPFCKSKCPYCDFNSHVREGIDTNAWKHALLAELRYYRQLTENRPVSSVFFGGGTPSLMPPALVAALLEEIDHLWGMEPHCEITLEANPTSVEAANFAALAAAGVNRLSLGVQSLRAEALHFLGREHSVEEARSAIALAQRYFPRYSFDMIYARPGQTVQTWQDELEEALVFADDHLSLYQLTIEPGTAFHHAVTRGELEEMDADTAATLYQLTHHIMSAHALIPYEISNYARHDEESRHNLTYWRYGDYLGIGPGAHGRVGLLLAATRTKGEAHCYKEGDSFSVKKKHNQEITHCREQSASDAQACSGEQAGANRKTHKYSTTAIRSPEKWLESVNQNGHGIVGMESLTRQEQAMEALIMGLRLKEGIPLARLEQLAGTPPDTWLDMQAVKQFQENGMLEPSQTLLQVTENGRLLLNTILTEIQQ